MNIFEKIHTYLYELDTESFYKNIGIFLGGNVILMFLLGYFYMTSMITLRQALQDTYKKQTETQNLLGRLTKVQKHSEEINSILAQEPNFRIKNFYDDTLKKLNLESKQQRDADVSEEDVLKGKYTELKLVSLLRGIDTRQLCDLLQAIEQKPRIYMKEVIITKKDSLLDINITIATLTSHLDDKKAS